MGTRAMKAAIGVVGVAAMLAGCVTSGPCGGTDCEKIGWGTEHYTCKGCEKPERAAAPVAAPVAPVVPATQPTTFTAHYRTSHPCLAQSTRNEVDKVIVWMRQHPKTQGHIVGFTDATEKGADALSARRARVVRDYMVRKGISGDRLSHEGRGAADPVANNATAAGRAENRRVEITVD